MRIIPIIIYLSRKDAPTFYQIEWLWQEDSLTGQLVRPLLGAGHAQQPSGEVTGQKLRWTQNMWVKLNWWFQELWIIRAFQFIIKNMIFNQHSKQFWNKSNIPNFDTSLTVLMAEFYKIGRTFRQRCLRTYFQVRQFLLYSDVGNGNSLKGYVELDRVYASFRSTPQEHQICLTHNGHDLILLTTDFQQFQAWKQALFAWCILPDFENHFTLEHQIGAGSFSNVFQCRSSDGTQYAAKIMNKQLIKQNNHKHHFTEQLLNEIHALRLASHPNIVRLHRVFESATKIYLVMELIRGGVLTNSAKRVYTAEDFKLFLTRLLDALAHIHSLSIMHRDIKPLNIMLRNNDLRDPCLIDFGLAAFEWQKHPPFPQCGSLGYSAPEVIKYDETKKMYTSQCDMFSLGITLFVMYDLFGYNPFKASDNKQTLKRNYESFFEIPVSKYPIQLENLIAQMTKKYPKDRMTAAQALQHSFFHQTCFFQFSLPKQILTRQQFDLQQRTEVVAVMTSGEMDQVNLSYGNAELGMKMRTVSIVSNPIRSNNGPETNGSMFNYSPYSYQQQQKGTLTKEFAQDDFLLDCSEAIVDSEHLHSLTLQVNSKVFQMRNSLQKCNTTQ